MPRLNGWGLRFKPNSGSVFYAAARGVHLVYLSCGCANHANSGNLATIREDVILRDAS